MANKIELIVIREPVLESIGKDAGTFVMFAAMIGLGVLLDSSAMQWVGALLFLIGVIGRSFYWMKRSTLSIPEARAKLDQLERDYGNA